MCQSMATVKLKGIGKFVTFLYVVIMDSYTSPMNTVLWHWRLFANEVLRHVSRYHGENNLQDQREDVHNATHSSSVSKLSTEGQIFFCVCQSKQALVIPFLVLIYCRIVTDGNDYLVHPLAQG